MGRKCNVLDCPSDSNRPEDNGVTFHKMPFHPDLRPKWIELCRIPKERQTNKVIYVCSRHFRRTDFCNFKGTKYMLRQGALPSVFPWTKSIVLPQTSKSMLPLDEELPLEIKTEEEEDVKPNITELELLEVKTEAVEESEEEKPKDSKAKKDISPSTKKETSIIKKEPTVITKKEINEIPIPNTSPVIKTEPINFLPGTRIEANDFNEKWNPATILEVDYDENEVFVEFDKHLNKANEWIPMDSSRLRPYQPPPTNIETYVVGERVLAAWIKPVNKFPATIKKVIDSETYEVLFDDGYLKIMKYSKLAKIKDVSAIQGRLKHSSPLFDPVVGSKAERRERKRKLNVAELFGKTPIGKKFKGEDYIKSDPEDDVQSQEEFRSTGSSSQNDGEEWTCRWLNGEPVGIESEIEGLEGPRRSIIVADHRLPPGWEKHLTQKLHGNNAGKWDTIIMSPHGKRFTSRAQVKTWLEDNKLDYNVERFDFCLHINRAKKLGLYEITDPEAIALAKAAHPKDPSKPNKKSSKSVHSNKVSTPKSGSTINLPITPEIHETYREEEEEDSTNYLKIIHEDGSYKCPIEGCGKIFRKENLAQMHVKHYHPESAKLLGSTPNVADLAYARTVGESIDDIVPKLRSVGSPLEKDKIIKSESTPKPKSSLKILQPKHQKMEEGEIKKSINSPPFHIPKQSKDSEIIKLLNSEPKSKTIDTIFETVASKSLEPVSKLDEPATEKYPDFKLKDLLHKAEPIPPFKKEDRPTGIKTLLPVIRQSLDDYNQEMDDHEIGLKIHAIPKAVDRLKPRKRQSSEHSDAKKRRQSFRYEDDLSDFYDGDSHSQDSFKEKKVLELPPVAPVTESPQVIIEGGEVIRLVHMRSEEIINCTCGITEEDGLMIQCELCLCWQHAHCNNIQRENEVPEKYICYICKNPQKMRVSKKYLHDQEWLKQGVLPSASYHTKDEEALKDKFEKLRKSHELSGCLVELNEYVHNLRIKLNIADNKDHPKLYLWSKPWEKPIPNENLNALLNSKLDHKQDIKDENLNSSFSGSDHSYIKSSTFGDIALKSMLEPPVEEIKQEKHIIDDQKIKSESELISILEDGTDIKTDLKQESTEFPKIDLNTMIANNLKTEPKDEILPVDNKENALSGILSSGSLELALSQTDLVTSFAHLNEVEATNTVPAVHIPQPEAVIDPSDCRMNLIDHVAHFQGLVDERLNCIEAEISELEDQDSNLGADDDEDAYPKMKQTLQMLLNDLTTMRQIAALSN